MDIDYDRRKTRHILKKKDVKVTRKLPADSSVKRIAGMIAVVIYEMDNTDFNDQEAENNPYQI